DDTPKPPEDFGVSSVSSVVGTHSKSPGENEEQMVAASEVSSDAREVSSDSEGESLELKPVPTEVDEDGTATSPSAALGSRPKLPYTVIVTENDLIAVLNALEETDTVGLDIETTGLDSRTARTRLIGRNVDPCDGGRHSSLIALFLLPGTALPPLWAALSEKALTGHNLKFDLQFLMRLGFEPSRPVTDTMLLSQV